MSKTDRGTTVVAVGEKEYTLACNLKVVKRIEAAAGSLMAAYNDVQSCKLTRIAQIVALGSGQTPKPKELEALEEEIFQAGILEVMAPVRDYLAVLVNPSLKDADDEDEAPAEQATASGNE